MKLKDKLFTFGLCLLVIFLYFFIGNNKEENINHLYNVYLDGSMIGAITDEKDLYKLINQKQLLIKQKYDVSNVYPPENLKIVENYSYDETTTSIDNIYNKIEALQDFTIKGYEVSFSAYENTTKESAEDEDASNGHEAFNVYILDKKVLKEALKSFILSFIDEESFNEYMKGTQETLEDIGKVYEKLEILEDITIREKYISINEKIYQNSEELTQDLLFGFNHKENWYTVKEGDTIESISEANKLNTQEFLVANPKYTSETALLTIGDKVNITLIDPEISFSSVVLEMSEEEEAYSTIIERDESKPSDYNETKIPGVTGLSLQTKRYSVINDTTMSDVEFIGAPTVIRKKVDKVVVKGRKTSTAYGKETETYVGSGWRWPTEIPYAITDEYGWRWGKIHQGLDISGTPKDSYVLAANDGIVVEVNNTCKSHSGSDLSDRCGHTFGNYIIIDHGNNIYTLYGHLLPNILVKEGQYVSIGESIGQMGNSGMSTGRHLHFAYSIGHPFNGGTYKNPREIFPKR